MTISGISSSRSVTTINLKSPSAQTPAVPTQQASFVQILGAMAERINGAQLSSKPLIERMEKLTGSGGGGITRNSLELLKLQVQFQDLHANTEFVTRSVDSVIQTVRKLQQSGQ